MKKLGWYASVHPNALYCSCIYKQGLARVFERQGKHVESLKCLQKCLQMNAVNVAAKYKSAWMLFQSGNPPAALNIMLELSPLYQNNATASVAADYQYRLGRIYWAIHTDYRQDKQYCFDLFVKAAQLNPQFDEPFEYLGHYYRQIQSDRSRAQKCYQKAFTLNPGNQPVARLLADLYEKEFGDSEAAFAVYRTVADNDIRSSWAWRAVGQYHMVRIIY